MRSVLHYLLPCCLIVILTSCNNTSVKKDNPGGDLHASRFRITDYGVFKRVDVINPWQQSVNNSFTYYLFKASVPVPDTIAQEKVIRVPVKRIICMSTTHLAMIRALGVTDAVAGLSGRNLVYDQEIREKADSGVIPDVGYESNLDKELVVSLKPDLMMAYGVDPSSAGYLAKLNELGVKIMYNADYLEQTPLARAEWIKVFGALFDREREADSIFNSISTAYAGICDSVRTASGKRPKVMFGGPWEDVWYVAPANSYAIRLIADAGGDYIYGDLYAAASQPYPVESVFVKSLEADVWLNPGAAKTLNELFSYDYRLEKLPVAAKGAVFNNNRRLSPQGGNDYWESAVIHPDILLRDLVSILHPELYPGYEPHYYRQLR